MPVGKRLVMRICRYSIDGKCTNETVACEQCNSTEDEIERIKMMLDSLE